MQKTLIQRFVPSDYLSHVQLTGDANSYTSGGFPFALSDFQLTDSIDDMLIIVQSGPYTAEWVPSTLSLRIETDPGTGLAEVGNGGSTAGLIVDLYAFGR